MKTLFALSLAMIISIAVMAQTATITADGTVGGIGRQTVTLTAPSSSGSIDLNPTYVETATGGVCAEPQKEIVRTTKQICVCINTAWYCVTGSLES